MELIDFQCNEFIKTKFNEVPRLDFYRTYVPAVNFPKLSKNAARMSSVWQHIPFRRPPHKCGYPQPAQVNPPRAGL